MTGEHIYSDIVLKEFDDVAPLTWDRKRGKTHGGDPIIKDLCSDCNSGTTDLDAAMGSFAKSHLKNEFSNRDHPGVDGELLKRWAVKTASNLSRAEIPADDWWKAAVPYILGKNTYCPCDVFFGRWDDLSPERFLSLTNVVTVIDSHLAILVGFEAGYSNHLKNHLNHCRVIKVGWGVFIVMHWKLEEKRHSVLCDLVEFGWQFMNDSFWLAPNVYNSVSCITLGVVTHPRKDTYALLKLDELGNLSENI